MRNLILVLALMTPSLVSADELTSALENAAKTHKVSVSRLKAIAMVESGGDLSAHRQNTNNTVDVGVMQINSVHFDTTCAHYRVYTLKGNTLCAALLLAKKKKRWEGKDKDWFGRYHSNTPSRKTRYANKIRAAMQHYVTK